MTREEMLNARRAAYAAMPPEKKAARRAKENAAARARRLSESLEQRAERLSQTRERVARIRAAETAEKRAARLQYFREYKPAYVAKNKDRISAYEKARYLRNRDRILDLCRQYRAENKAALNERRKQKLKNDPIQIVCSRLRHRLYMSLRSAAAGKSSRTIELAGCTAAQLVEWVESQFVDGMSWKNAGEWHIDHIIPLASFDIACPEQQRVAFHYTNLRPLWGILNAAKRDTLPIPKPATRPWNLADVASARIAVGVAKQKKKTV